HQEVGRGPRRQDLVRVQAQPGHHLLLHAAAGRAQGEGQGMRIAGRSAGRVVTVAVTVLVALGSLVGAATAGAHTPEAESVGGLGSGGGGLDYGKDQAGRLQPLSPDFIAQSLGLTFGSSAPGAGIPGPAGFSTSAPGSIATGPPINPVSTPVLQCVNGHQTEDPLSPPCISQFTGDNGGATYSGVSRDEVRVLIRITGAISDGGTPLNTFTPTESLVDLDRPASANEHVVVTKLRELQRYFNHHFQLYGRRIHVFVYFDGRPYSSEGDLPRHNREAALANLWSVRPFAAIEWPPLESDDGGAFADTLARAGVMTFLPDALQTLNRLRRVPERLWGYLPTTQQMADLYSSYVCQKVVGEPVAMNGDAGENGNSRRLALLSPDNTRPPQYAELTQLVRERLSACGAPVVAEAHLTPTGECGGIGAPASVATEAPNTAQAAAIMQRFRDARVTTVLWLGCNDSNIGPGALAANYRPEWVLLGDGLADNTFTVVADRSDVVFDHHAVVVTPMAALGRLAGSHCYDAQREVDPSLPADPEYVPRRVLATAADASVGGMPPPFNTALDAYLGCYLYSDLLQTVGAVQLGGPRLTADSVAAGLHALSY